MAEESKSKKEKAVPTKYPAKPTSIATINSDYIKDYCVANKQVKWLKDVVNKKSVNKNGEEGLYNFFQVRKEFVEKFFSELTKKTAPKSKTFYDIVMELED